MGHLMMENRNGLIIDARLTETSGTAERTTALDMIADNASPGSTVGGDKNYDTTDFVAGCRERGCTPHVSQNDAKRRSAIDACTTRHAGYRISTIKRKRIEEPFGWMKTVGGLRKTRHRGRGLVEWFFVLTATAYNLVSEDSGHNGMSLCRALEMTHKPQISGQSAHQAHRPNLPSASGENLRCLKRASNDLFSSLLLQY
jgi:hypothetical protein